MVKTSVNDNNFSSIQNSIICNNCLKIGHTLNNCRLPITSYGIIAFRYNMNKKIEYLMIRRKDTFGYIDFLRGKYSPYNVEQLQTIIDEMSIEEKERIKNENYQRLRNILWSCDLDACNYNQEEIISQKKFENIKNGILIGDKLVKLNEIVNKSNTKWSESEWEFPKGRRNSQEKDIDTAIREFEEETGYSINMTKIIENVIPYEEIFIGSNYKCYKNKYYLAYLDNNIEILDKYQKTEVSKIEWKTYEKCLESIRDINLEKKQLITNINRLLNNLI